MKDEKLFKGILVTKIHEKGESKTDPIFIGVVADEYDAKCMIAENADYYNCSDFEYDRKVIDNRIIFTSRETGEKIIFSYEKCLVIRGV